MSTNYTKRRIDGERPHFAEGDELREWFEKIELPSQALKAAYQAVGELTDKVEQHSRPKPSARHARSVRTRRRSPDGA